MPYEHKRFSLFIPLPPDTPMTYQHRRTWRERMFSRPWRPWIIEEERLTIVGLLVEARLKLDALYQKDLATRLYG